MLKKVLLKVHIVPHVAVTTKVLVEVFPFLKRSNCLADTVGIFTKRQKKNTVATHAVIRIDTVICCT